MSLMATQTVRHTSLMNDHMDSDVGSTAQALLLLNLGDEIGPDTAQITVNSEPELVLSADTTRASSDSQEIEIFYAQNIK